LKSFVGRASRSIRSGRRSVGTLSRPSSLGRYAGTVTPCGTYEIALASRIGAAGWVDPCLKLPNDAALPNHYRCGHGFSSRTGTNGAIQCEWRHNARQSCGHSGNRRSKSVHPVRDNGSECQGRDRGSGLASVLCARGPGGLRRKRHSAGSKSRDGLGAGARRGVEGRLE
jgi:hypothetical protein